MMSARDGKGPFRGFFFVREKGMMERDQREAEVRGQKSESQIPGFDSGSWLLNSMPR
jgi:hypothetical protein